MVNFGNLHKLILKKKKTISKFGFYQNSKSEIQKLSESEENTKLAIAVVTLKVTRLWKLLYLLIK